MFADLDLRQSADVIPVRQYPHSLPDDVRHVQADGWFYCGALENYPEIIAAIQRHNPNCGPLLGTSPEALRQVRDPQWLVQRLRSAGIAALDVLPSSRPPEADGSWLQKPLASAGGRSIRVWNYAATQVPFAEPYYFHRRTSGVALSAIFFYEANHIEWLGGASELQAQQSSHPPSTFAYCGSCGPLHRINFSDAHSVDRNESCRLRCRCHVGTVKSMPTMSSVIVSGNAVFQSNVQVQLDKIARVLVRNAPALRGLVGLDFCLHNGAVWLTEVNPRFTASIEVLELSTRRSIVFGRDEEQVPRHPELEPPPPSTRMVAKQILYAPRRLIVGDLSRFARSSNPWVIPTIADVPLPGSVVEAEWPICTVFGAGPNFDEMRQQLRERVNSIHSLLSVG